MANSNLKNARNAKNDEFYTQYHDIEKEIGAYLELNPDAFRGKTVLMPCDDPEWSNFTKFFAQNFERYGIKKLISTSFAPESKNLKSKIHQAIDYRQGLSISQAYKIPNQQKMIATVKYLGLPFETGYTIEDPVLLIPKK